MQNSSHNLFKINYFPQSLVDPTPVLSKLLKDTGEIPVIDDFDTVHILFLKCDDPTEAGAREIFVSDGIFIQDNH